MNVARFLLRDGNKVGAEVSPDGLEVFTYEDQKGQLIHADVQGQKLRGDLLKELPFRFDRCQSVDHLSLLVFVAEDLKPFW